MVSGGCVKLGDRLSPASKYAMAEFEPREPN